MDSTSTVTSTGATDTTETTATETGAAAMCGNGVQEPGEECDDGNEEDVDACLAGCVVATCGDGKVWTGEEECDDGNKDDTDACLSSCVAASCGDGKVWAGEEGCDDGNEEDMDACLSSCVAASCGDGTVWAGEEGCDDGNEDDTDACLSSCVAANCGDGTVWAGEEGCDDGNEDDTDACPTTCVPAGCGDGEVWAGKEECDDGNDDDTDACLSTCKTAKCGDGKVEGKEECEDGNELPGDGCSPSCEHEYVMFATSAVYPGNFGGIMSADDICMNVAAEPEVGLGGTYVAWMSQTGDSAKDDLPVGEPLIRRDGEQIVSDAVELIQGDITKLDRPVNRDEHGNVVSGYVWTGTSAKGLLSGFYCGDWKAVIFGATVGGVSEVDGEWTSHDLKPCSGSHRIYCFRRKEE